MNNPAVLPLPSVPPRRSSRALLVVLLLCLVAALGLLLYRRPLLDWLSLRNYTPPASITALATADTMTASATRVFYVNHPAIENKTQFASSCNFGREQTIVLGCYHGNQLGIHLLDVSDPRLNGVEQVTAAHEMLHAEYDRLTPDERGHINQLLQTFYDQDVTDPRIRATIDAYRKSEPNDVVNEMHSVFGTEIMQLTPELENYYRRYFTHRATIAGYAAAYSQEFTSRQNQVAAYDRQLQQLKATIDAQTAQLSSDQVALQAQRNQLESERGSVSTAQYNRDVDTYNAHVNSYNAEIASTRSLIQQYNALVDKRNAIALEEQELARAISGDNVPASQ